MRILGIDPGSSATGFGVVESGRSGLRHVAHGVLRPPRGLALAPRLARLQSALVDVIQSHAPDVAVVERVFVAASPRSALVLGQARGAVLAALGAAALPVSEYAALQIKQAVVGSGQAEKRQVQAMVRRLLGLDQAPAADASDALAAAICHAHAGRLLAYGEMRARPGGRRRARPRFVVRRAP